MIACAFRRPLRATPLVLAMGLAGLMTGCASPGPPRPPSLQMPEPVTGLSAQRSGDVVTLRFVLPTRSTDKTLLRPQVLKGVLCREVRPGGSCIAVQGVAETLSGGTGKRAGSVVPIANSVTLKDVLPTTLSGGPQRLLAYRVEFFAPSGGSAGRSDAAFTAAGSAPAPLEALQARGSRSGVELQWQTTAPLQGEQDTVVIEREDLGRTTAAFSTASSGTTPVSAKRRGRVAGPMQPSAGDDRGGVVLLDAHAGSGEQTLDATAVAGRPYRYAAYRQRRVAVGGQTVTVRSASTPAIAFTLAGIYAPAAPTGLTAAGFANDAAPGPAAFVVSLIWQPVDDAGVVGYNVYRQAAEGSGVRSKLNAASLALPTFDDATADRTQSYRYSVTAVDDKGNESAAVTTVLSPR